MPYNIQLELVLSFWPSASVTLHHNCIHKLQYKGAKSAEKGNQNSTEQGNKDGCLTCDAAYKVGPNKNGKDSAGSGDTASMIKA
jgi:hypothetical protein